MHYYRVYAKILTKKDQDNNLGYISHCFHCGNRVIGKETTDCIICKNKLHSAGPLWIGQLFDEKFVTDMIEEIPKFLVDDKCKKILEKCKLEAKMPVAYYTLDDIASKTKRPPLKMKNMIKRLQDAGFIASPTSLNPTGFRTDCSIDNMKKMLEN